MLFDRRSCECEPDTRAARLRRAKRSSELRHLFCRHSAARVPEYPVLVAVRRDVGREEDRTAGARLDRINEEVEECLAKGALVADELAAAALDEDLHMRVCGPIRDIVRRLLDERRDSTKGALRGAAQTAPASARRSSSIRSRRRHMAACSRPIRTRLSPESSLSTSREIAMTTLMQFFIAWARVARGEISVVRSTR